MPFHRVFLKQSVGKHQNNAIYFENDLGKICSVFFKHKQTPPQFYCKHTEKEIDFV